jgi:ubiquitin carboxyl-terminal hydrolase L5
MNKEQLNIRLNDINFKIKENDNIIKIEENKMNKYKEENQRRQHNYIPFIFELLKSMGEKGVLDEAYKEAFEEENKKNQETKK